MSVKVEITELAETMATYAFAYLMTIGDDMRVHVVAVTPAVVDDHLLVGDVGRRTLTNLEQRPDVSLVWPPVDQGGYSLIVDAAASVEGERVVLRPARAVLHRPASAAYPAGDGCGSDCVPVGE